MAYGMVKHKPKTYRASGYGYRDINVKVTVSRAYEGQAGKYSAGACVLRKGRPSFKRQGYGQRCGHGLGVTPTKAIKAALHNLATGLK